MSEVKGKPITKEMWKAIEEELSRSWVSVRFAYMGYELSIVRVRVNESKTCLQVYIDDLVDGSWTTIDLDEGNTDCGSRSKVFSRCMGKNDKSALYAFKN